MFTVLPSGKNPAATARETTPAWSKSARKGSSGNCCACPGPHPGSGKSQSHRYPPRPEGLLEFLEAAGDTRTALRASAVLGNPVVEDSVPVASDHCASAARAVSRAAFGVVDVACIHMAQAVPQCDLARAGEGRCRRLGNVGHLVVGVEGREVQRHVGSEFTGDPAAFGVDLLIAVVPPGDEKRGDLEPDFGFVLEVGERVE